MFFWNSSFFDDPTYVGNLISGSSAFSKTTLNIWKFTVHVLLKPGLENFEQYFSSMWDECRCAVVWAFFGIAFLWDWNENWPFPVLWPLLSFLNLLAYWVQHFHSIIFQDLKQLNWNSITSPSFVRSWLPKAHLTSYSRMSSKHPLPTTQERTLHMDKKSWSQKSGDNSRSKGVLLLAEAFTLRSISVHADFQLSYFKFKRWCCENAALNVPANLENSAVATVLEKVCFHFNPKERQCQRMVKLLNNCTHLTY